MNEHFERASRHLVCGEYEAAADLFRDLLKAQGDHPTLRHNLALSLECCKNFEEAAKEYSTIIREFPKYVCSYIGMANCYFYEADLEQCEGMLRAAREIDPYNLQTIILLSEVLCLRGCEAEGIELHREALELLDFIEGVCTTNHALCYGDFGEGGPQFYMWWEKSLLQRDAFPALPPVEASEVAKKEQPLLVLLAHAGNATAISKRLRVLNRQAVYLAALDDVSQRMLAEHTPDAAFPALSFDPSELPALALHVGQHLISQGLAVLLPAEDGGEDQEKVGWAKEQHKNGNSMAINGRGDLFAMPPLPSKALHPRRVPPALKRFAHAAPDTFAKIFS